MTNLQQIYYGNGMKQNPPAPQFSVTVLFDLEVNYEYVEKVGVGPIGQVLPSTP